MIVVCFPESIPIYNLAFNDIDFRVIERGDFYFGKRIAKSKAKKKLKSLEPQIIFDLTGSMVSASLIFSIRAREIIGMNNNQFKKIYDYFTPVRNIPHLMDMYLDATALFTSLSYKESIKYFPVNIINDGKIMIHPLAGWKAKEWNFNNFFKLAINLAEHHKVCMIIPINKISDDVVNELMEGNVEVIQTRSLEELIEHIKLCSVFISNDSGPLYIASLLGKPNFSIYGPTNPEFSRPFGTNHQFIVQSLKCSPEKNKQYCFTYAGMSGCPSFECMNLLTVEEVYNGLIPLINKYCHSIVE
jgi:ADP-heptose:LPS heptosyltransferase